MSVEQRSASRAGKDAGKGSGLKKIVAASMVGTVVEWYEFFLYATAATLVFGKYFFPSTGNELDGIIQSAPTVNAAEFSGNVQITGRFSRKEATLLAQVLNSGALPFRVRIESVSYTDD